MKDTINILFTSSKDRFFRDWSLCSIPRAGDIFSTVLGSDPVDGKRFRIVEVCWIDPDCSTDHDVEIQIYPIHDTDVGF